MNINGEELILLIIIAVIVIGPERLPTYAEQLAQLVRNLKKMATGATERVKEELGEEAADLDLSQLDPRKYDPRRIVREALSDDILPASRPARSRSSAATSSTVRKPSESSRIARENAARRRAEVQAKKQAAAAAAAAEESGDPATGADGGAPVPEAGSTPTDSRTTAAGTTAVSEGGAAISTPAGTDGVPPGPAGSAADGDDADAQDLVAVGAPFDDEAT